MASDTDSETQRRALVALSAEPSEAAALSAILAATAADFGDAEVILFGSRARRDHSPESDYDILVLPEEGGPCPLAASERIERAAREASGEDAKVNVQVIPADRLEDAHFEFPFVPSAVAEGVDLARTLRLRAAATAKLGREPGAEIDVTVDCGLQPSEAPSPFG